MLENIKRKSLYFAAMSKSEFGKNSGIVLFGNILSSAFGLISMIIVSRAISPSEFGIYSIEVVTMGLIVQFLDFGLTTGIVKFASEYLQNDKSKVDMIFKISFKIKIIVSLITLIIGMYISEFLSLYILKKSELIFPLKIAFIEAIGLSFIGYATAILQARKLYKKLAFVTLINPLIKMIFIVLFYITYRLNLFNTLQISAIIPLISLLVGYFIIPKDFLKSRIYTKNAEEEIFRDLFHFSKWVFASSLATMLIMRLDTYMLTGMSTLEEVGYYSSANTLAMIFPLITGTLATVLLPTVSSYTQKYEFNNYILSMKKIAPGILLTLIPLIIFSEEIIKVTFGPSYLNSALIFQILIVSFGFSIIANPISLVLYSINKPEVLFYINVGQLFINFISNCFLIPLYGSSGAALSTLVVRFIGTFFIIFYVDKCMQKITLAGEVNAC